MFYKDHSIKCTLNDAEASESFVSYFFNENQDFNISSAF